MMPSMESHQLSAPRCPHPVCPPPQVDAAARCDLFLLAVDLLLEHEKGLEGHDGEGSGEAKAAASSLEADDDIRWAYRTISTCFYMVTLDLEDSQYGDILVYQRGQTGMDQLATLAEYITLYKGLLGRGIYPVSWTSVLLVQLKATVRLLSTSTSSLIGASERPDGCPNAGILRCAEGLFDLALNGLLKSPELQLEDANVMPPAKASYIKSAFGDMRSSVVADVKRLWDLLKDLERPEGSGCLQSCVFEAVIKPCLQLVESPCEMVSQLTEHIYFEAVKREYMETGAMNQTGFYTIDSVDEMVKARASASIVSSEPPPLPSSPPPGHDSHGGASRLMSIVEKTSPVTLRRETGGGPHLPLPFAKGHASHTTRAPTLTLPRPLSSSQVSVGALLCPARYHCKVHAQPMTYLREPCWPRSDSSGVRNDGVSQELPALHPILGCLARALPQRRRPKLRAGGNLPVGGPPALRSLLRSGKISQDTSVRG